MTLSEKKQALNQTLPLDVYKSLAAEFDKHFTDPRGLTYLTGNQVISRLNEVLGPAGWSFEIREHGFDADSDEIWVLGRLELYVEGKTVICREQFGSQKHNRRRNNGAILDYGFDLKGAGTDALKKCASLIGVGLYLSEKEGGIPNIVDEDATYKCEECKVDIMTDKGGLINADQAQMIRARFNGLYCRDHRGPIPQTNSKPT